MRLPKTTGSCSTSQPLRRRRVAIDPECPAALLAAIGAHPALAVAKGMTPDVEAVLDCGTLAAARGVATLRVLADRMPTRPSGPVQWSSAVPESRRIRLDPERMQVAARLGAGRRMRYCSRSATSL